MGILTFLDQNCPKLILSTIFLQNAYRTLRGIYQVNVPRKDRPHLEFLRVFNEQGDKLGKSGPVFVATPFKAASHYVISRVRCPC